MAVDVETAEIRGVTSMNRESGDISHGSPAPLSDGSHFMYVAKRKDLSVAMLASAGDLSSSLAWTGAITRAADGLWKRAVRTRRSVAGTAD